MRAVFITPVLPAATGNGLSMRAGIWLEALAQRFETDVVAAALFAPHTSAAAFTEALAASITMTSGHLKQESGVPRAVPTLDEESQRLLSDRIATADVVVVFRLYLAGLAQEAHARGIPIVLDLDDLDWVREERLGNPVEAEAYRRHAEEKLPLATITTTASRDDTARDVDDEPTWMHVANGVRRPTSTTSAVERDVDLLFVGTLGYQPNVEAASWLVNEVLPQLPGVTAALVGAAPSPDVVALERQGVTIAADVADVTPWYQRSRVCVVPIHAGSGTRTKIPEAWIHRRPVVSTTIGAEGIDVTGAALIADDAAPFAAACRSLLNDASLAERLIAAGADHYESGHAFELAVAQANAAIDAALRATGIVPPAHRVRL